MWNRVRGVFARTTGREVITRDGSLGSGDGCLIEMLNGAEKTFVRAQLEPWGLVSAGIELIAMVQFVIVK